MDMVYSRAVDSLSDALQGYTDYQSHKQPDTPILYEELEMQQENEEGSIDEEHDTLLQEEEPEKNDILFNNQRRYTRYPNSTFRNQQRSQYPNQYHRQNGRNFYRPRQQMTSGTGIRSTSLQQTSSNAAVMVCFNCLKPDCRVSRCKHPKDLDRIRKNLQMWKQTQIQNSNGPYGIQNSGTCTEKCFSIADLQEILAAETTADPAPTIPAPSPSVSAPHHQPEASSSQPAKPTRTHFASLFDDGFDDAFYFHHEPTHTYLNPPSIFPSTIFTPPSNHPSNSPSLPFTTSLPSLHHPPSILSYLPTPFNIHINMSSNNNTNQMPASHIDCPPPPSAVPHTLPTIPYFQAPIPVHYTPNHYFYPTYFSAALPVPTPAHPPAHGHVTPSAFAPDTTAAHPDTSYAINLSAPVQSLPEFLRASAENEDDDDWAEGSNDPADFGILPPSANQPGPPGFNSPGAGYQTNPGPDPSPHMEHSEDQCPGIKDQLAQPITKPKNNFCKCKNSAVQSVPDLDSLQNKHWPDPAVVADLMTPYTESTDNQPTPGSSSDPSYPNARFIETSKPLPHALPSPSTHHNSETGLDDFNNGDHRYFGHVTHTSRTKPSVPPQQQHQPPTTSSVWT